MGFTSISTRITNLPLVLVGPILRRVTANSVSVFVVTKESSNVTLHVYDNSTIPFLTQTTSTIALGQNVHALVITVNTNGTVLTPNKVYTYNLSFNTTPMIDVDGELTEGILVKGNYRLPDKIAYGIHNYPTFLLPSNDKNQLKFSHGSCRKPHGGATDALRGLDSILRTTISTETKTINLNERPQFLCLTGDQIYADDVADSLLYMLIDIEENLFNWGTAGLFEKLPGLPTPAQLNPGKRFTVIGQEKDDTTPGKFSNSEECSKSHLIKLVEYYGMYLMVWSDVLWPENASNFPTYEQVSDNAPRTETVTYVEDVNGIPKVKTKIINTERFNTYLEENKAIVEFHRSLKYVRKSLANIPVYMIFDDHEITDDWFLTRKWVENALVKDSISKRIMQNGMTAFAVFQAWGNTPKLFASGRGLEILNSVQAINTAGPNLQNFAALADLVLPRLATDKTKLEKINTNNVDWNFHIDFEVFKLVILDTRTQRGYVGDESAPELIHLSYIDAQVPTTNATFAIVVSPAPVFGNIGVESIQKFTASSGSMAYVGATIFGSVGASIASTPGLIVGAYAGGVLGLLLTRNKYENDYEAWVFQEKVFHEFLLRLSTFESTVLLSGDVHYGFSASIEFWKQNGTIWMASGISQICSSSLKNSTSHGFGSTEKAATLFLVKPKLRGTDGYLVFNKAKDINIKYRTFFEVDNRSRTGRFEALPASFESSNAQIEAGYKHRNSISWDSQRYVVGRDNICFVKLEDNGNKLKHEFWFVMTDKLEDSDKFEITPGTIHDVICKVSENQPLF
jgi:phosphodiesterase/alkaline phosphatase D-like protein